MKKKEEQHSSQNIYFWFPLDNLAKIFPSNRSSRLTTLFRMTAIMAAPVKISLLQNAFNHLLNRCPYFKVQLKAGFFWYYFQSNPIAPKIMADSKYPCMNMPFKKEGVLPLRVRAFKNRIAVEFSHILTDGSGALSFLKALAAEYLRLSGVDITDWNDLIKVSDNPDEKEGEDSFRKYYQKNIPSPNKLSEAFHIPFKFIDKNKYYITTGIMSACNIIKKAKEKNVSLTEFLVALYFDAIQDLYFLHRVKKNNRNPIRISIPVNLRQMYHSKTMRNFFLLVSPEIDPRLGRFSFDEILQKIYHFMRIEFNEKYINQQIKRNVGGEVHPLIRSLPLFIKNIGLAYIYNFIGDNQYTTNFSNLGRVMMPECLSNYIKGFEMYPPPNPKYKISCTVISFKDRLSITFGRLIEGTDIERFFFTKIIKLGIPVKIESNKE
jgi:NRPS condensation-like uncharacterized protein